MKKTRLIKQVSFIFASLMLLASFISCAEQEIPEITNEIKSETISEILSEEHVSDAAARPAAQNERRFLPTEGIVTESFPNDGKKYVYYTVNDEKAGRVRGSGIRELTSSPSRVSTTLSMVHAPMSDVLMVTTGSALGSRVQPMKL